VAATESGLLQRLTGGGDARVSLRRSLLVEAPRARARLPLAADDAVAELIDQLRVAEAGRFGVAGVEEMADLAPDRITQKRKSSNVSATIMR